MLTMIILLALIIVFDIAALRWGVNSSESVTSCEWKRRWQWYHHDDDQWTAC